MRVTHNEVKTFPSAPQTITETDDTYVIEVSVAGYQQEDISVDVKATELRVSGKQRKDVAKGAFTPGFTNTYGIDPENPDMEVANADGRSLSLENGILTLVMPKHASCVAESIAFDA
jgi:HSP20 family protein